MSSIKKHWDDAGSRPGQRQDLTIEFVSRSGNSVKIHWELKVRSNGTDMYDYSTRHNSARIYSPKDTRVSKKNYQAKGHKDHASVSDTFTLHNIDNETDKIDFWYKNKRVWAKHTDAYEPRSTGVVDKTHVGTLSIPKNVKYKITFDYIISDTVKEYSCWYGNNFTIPNLSPSSKRFFFEGWTTKKYSNNLTAIKNAKATVQSGKVLDNVTSNHSYYAVWKPQTRVYCFYAKGSRNGNPSLKKTHTYGTPTTMPDADTMNNGKHKYPGYTFKYWISKETNKHYKAKSECSEWVNDTGHINFVAHVEPDPNTVEFQFLNPDKNIRTFKKDSKEAYYTDSEFDMSKALTNASGSKRFNTVSAWPGYKLVGWSTTPLSIAQPGKSLKVGKHTSGADKLATKVFTIYPVSGKQVFDYDYFKDHKLVLYAYYEYYTTCYVYTEEGWKLAMPYVYTEEGWKMALTYVYTEEGWKL